jgi:hypothetical protein
MVVVALKEEVRFTINAQAAEYLHWLSKNTVLGKTPNEVAAQILVARLSEMRGENFKHPPGKV